MLSYVRRSLSGTLGGGTRFHRQSFDPDPDLRITVGRQPWQEVLVDSRALCRVSPVLRKRLTEAYATQDVAPSPSRSSSSSSSSGRARASAMIRQSFPDDDPEAFCILMDIIHSRYDIANSIPIPGIETLFRVVRLAHKYEMVRVLRPYSSAWLAKFTVETRTNITHIEPSLLKFLLFAAWTLGEDRLFQVVGERLAVLCSLDEKAELVENTSGIKLADFEYLQEIDVLNAIKRFRHDRLMVIVNACNKMGEKLTENASASRSNTNFGTVTTRGRPLVLDHPSVSREDLGVLVIRSVSAGVTQLFLPSASAHPECEDSPSPLFRMALVDVQARVNQTLSHADLAEWRAWHALEVRQGEAAVENLISPIMEAVLRGNAEQSFVKRDPATAMRGHSASKAVVSQQGDDQELIE